MVTTDLPIEMQQQIAMQKIIDENRDASTAKTESIRMKQEALRMAKEIAMENHRTSAAGTSLTSTDILAIAADLEAFIVS